MMLKFPKRFFPTNKIEGNLICGYTFLPEKTGANRNELLLKSLNAETKGDGIRKIIVNYFSTKNYGLPVEEVINSKIIPDIDSAIQTCAKERHKDLFNEIKKVLMNRGGDFSNNPEGALSPETFEDIDKKFKMPFEFADDLNLKFSAF